MAVQTVTLDVEAMKADAVAENRLLTVWFALAVITMAMVAAAGVTVAIGIGLLSFAAWSVGPDGALVFDGAGLAPLAAGIFAATTAAVAGLILGLTWQRWRQVQRGGGRAVALRLGGRHVDPERATGSELRFCNTVAEIALAANRPAPAVWVLDREHAINVFNAGWSDDTTVIGITSGALVGLERDELQAVAAQAMSHVLHDDARLNLRLMAMVIGLAGLVILGDDLVERARCRSRSYWGDDDDSIGSIPVQLAGRSLKVFGWVGVYLASAIQLSIARRHELLADTVAVELTRDPDAMRDALRRVGGHPRRGRINHHGRRSLNHLFLVDSGGRFEGTVHPPLALRIHRLDATWEGSMLEPIGRSDGLPDIYQSTVSVPATAAAGQQPPDDPLAAFHDGDGLVQFGFHAPLEGPGGTTPVLDPEGWHDAEPGSGSGSDSSDGFDADGDADPEGRHDAGPGPEAGSDAGSDDGGGVGDPSAGLHGAVAVAAMAARDRGELPAEIAAASWTPAGCRALLLAAIGAAAGLVTAEALSSRAAGAGIDDGLATHLESVVPAVAGLDSMRRVEVMFLAAGDALDAGADDVERVRRLVLQFVDGIDTRSLDGWIQARLAQATIARRASDRRPKTLEKLRGPYAEVLTFLAAVGGTSVTTAVSVGGYAAGLGSVPARDAGQAGIRSLDRAIGKLGRLGDDDRNRAVDGLLACIGADQVIRPVEARTTQAIAGAMGADIPVIRH